MVSIIFPPVMFRLRQDCYRSRKHMAASWFSGGCSTSVSTPQTEAQIPPTGTLGTYTSFDRDMTNPAGGNPIVQVGIHDLWSDKQTVSLASLYYRRVDLDSSVSSFSFFF